MLRGARLWNNVDDGLDLWYAYSALSFLSCATDQGDLDQANKHREFKSGVTIEDTISWGNGYNRSDMRPPLHAACCTIQITPSKTQSHK